jgi:hypothetical protein
MATHDSSTGPSLDEKQTAADLKDGAIASQTNIESGTIDIDTVAEAALVRKLDRWIIPPIMLLYLFSFLDRMLLLTFICLATDLKQVSISAMHACMGLKRTSP